MTTSQDTLPHPMADFDARNTPMPDLRPVMRRLASGVSIATSAWEGVRHGMTVTSFVSVSLAPPLVSVTLGKDTRTEVMVRRAGKFGISILAASQQMLAEVFAGKVEEMGNRFAGVETFTLGDDVPLIAGSLGAMTCRVVHIMNLPQSTLFLGEVSALWEGEPGPSLLYMNREFGSYGA